MIDFRRNRLKFQCNLMESQNVYVQAVTPKTAPPQTPQRTPQQEPASFFSPARAAMTALRSLIGIEDTGGDQCFSEKVFVAPAQLVDAKG